MEMEEKIIKKVSKIIKEWNPLGEKSTQIEDLNGYKTEAIDFLATYKMVFNGKIEKRLKNIIEEAFDIKVKVAAKKIQNIL